MLLKAIRRAFSRAKNAIVPLLIPSDWDEESYLSNHPDVWIAVKQGRLSSGFEHWQRRGRSEGRRLTPKMPHWLKNEMLALSEIEPKIFPSQAFVHAAFEHRPMKSSNAGELYCRLLREIDGRSFTHVFLIPWLKTGGSDLVSLHHVTTLANQFGAQILVLLTEDTDSPWLTRLPESVKTIHFGRAAADVNEYQAQIVLARLLLKLNAPVIHNMNSAIGWQLFCRYGAALRSESRLYTSLFCYDYSPEGEPEGFARQLENAYPYLDGVFSDNQAFPAELIETHGFDSSRFFVMQYPIRVSTRFAYQPDGGPQKILWAGRVDRQKRPDILTKIAQSLPDCTFHVYGTALLDTSRQIAETYAALSQLPNVILFGAYDGFDSIPADNYALCLYTTQWDGKPNVVLEALAAGLPVVAPDVGGIGEVIRSDSGFLVTQFDDVGAYVETIRRLLANPELIFAERTKRLQFLGEKHSPEAFAASLARITEYHAAPSLVGSVTH
jgi:glycosyltransferase involved in cell wall biosynthesis